MEISTRHYDKCAHHNVQQLVFQGYRHQLVSLEHRLLHTVMSTPIMVPCIDAAVKILGGWDATRCSSWSTTRARMLT